MSDNDEHKIHAAWRAASREEPSAALDEALRAAARREAGARPRRMGTSRAWWPLAAAATVAVLAIGIAQLTPPERVSPASVDETSSSPLVAKIDANKPAMPPTVPPTAATPTRNAAPAAAKTEPVTTAWKKESDARRPAEEDRRPPSLPAERLIRRESAAQTPAATAGRVLQQQSELAAARSDGTSAAAPSPAPPSPFPAASLARERAAAAPATPSAAPQTSVASAPAPAPATAGSGPSAEPTPAQNRLTMAQATAREAKRESDSATRPADEWIKDIRRLITERKLDEAAKELIAFREIYKERADSLLPSDLREFKR